MIIIVRHGQSMTNAKVYKDSRFNFSDSNNVLTLKGVQGAVDAGFWIEEYHPHPDLIITSGLARAKQTGMLIASALKTGVPLLHDPLFEEIRWYPNCGTYKSYSDDIFYDSIDAPPHDGAESQRDVYNRVIPRFLEVAKESLEKKYIVVAHYFVLRAVHSFLESGGPDMMPTYDPDNTVPHVITDEMIVSRV